MPKAQATPRTKLSELTKLNDPAKLSKKCRPFNPAHIHRATYYVFS